jgi:hypothetical protein
MTCPMTCPKDLATQFARPHCHPGNRQA